MKPWKRDETLETLDVKKNQLRKKGLRPNGATKDDLLGKRWRNERRPPWKRWMSRIKVLNYRLLKMKRSKIPLRISDQ